MESLKALRLKLERDVKEFNALKNNSRFGLLLSVLSPSHVLPCKYCGEDVEIPGHYQKPSVHNFDLPVICNSCRESDGE